MSSKVKIFDLAFGKGSFTNDRKNYQVRCPECGKDGSKKKLHIKLDDFRYHCWVCGLKGKNVLYLVKKLRPDLDVGNIKTPKLTVDQVDDHPPVVLPEGLIPVYRNTKDPDVKAVRNYLVKRGMTLADMYRWRVLAASKGQFRRYAVFPSFDELGSLNYYLGRSIDDAGFRYRNAKRKKTSVVFNEIDIDWSKHVYLVEGVFDAVMSPDNTVPIMGSELSKSSLLYERLVRNQTSVTISLDADARDKMYKIAKLLATSGCSVSVATYDGESDLGDMTKVNVRNVMKNAVPYNEYNGIRHKISFLKSGSIF